MEERSIDLPKQEANTPSKKIDVSQGWTFANT